MTIDQLPRDLPFSYAYIDDILIARANQAEHLHQVFQRISKFDLKINTGECISRRTKNNLPGPHN